MFIGSIKDIKKVEVTHPGAAFAIKQTLVGVEHGWDGWVMRLLTLAESGYTPKHSHPWPHINFIVSGKGSLFLGGNEYEVEAGHTAFVPDNVEHQFKNLGTSDFTFICIVPETGDK